LCRNRVAVSDAKESRARSIAGVAGAGFQRGFLTYNLGS
jgi:hypothetical protein